MTPDKEPLTPRAPLLTLILCSRNDAYMGNSRWRLQTVLNSLAERVVSIERSADVEVIVADWGSAVPLRDVLALEPAAAAIVRFVTVPPDVATRRQGDSAFPEVLALNAAARRARGRFIGRIDQDTIVGTRFLTWFFRELPSEASVYFSNRRGIPYRFAARCPERGHVDRFIRLFGSRLAPWRGNPTYDDVFWSSYVGIWLVPRAIWDDVGGYDERMIYYNWMEADMIRRVTVRCPIVDLGPITSHDFYHLEHFAPGTAGRPHGRKNPDLDRQAPPPPRQPNGPTWGLADCSLPVERARAVPAFGPTPVVPAGLVFAGLVARLGLEIARDRTAAAATRLRMIWRRRFDGAARSLSGQPLSLWPGTLWRLWHGRKANRAR